MPKTRPKGAEAVIEQDGEVYRRVVLADLKEPLTLEVNGETTVYEPKDIAVSSTGGRDIRRS